MKGPLRSTGCIRKIQKLLRDSGRGTLNPSCAALIIVIGLFFFLNYYSSWTTEQSSVGRTQCFILPRCRSNQRKVTFFRAPQLIWCEYVWVHAMTASRHLLLQKALLSVSKGDTHAHWSWAPQLNNALELHFLLNGHLTACWQDCKNLVRYWIG